MKKLLVIFSFFILLACNTQDTRRSLADAQTLSESYSEMDIIHFVVRANCDYDHFFEYLPMRAGGFYAYGYENDQPKLLIIPRFKDDDGKLVDWPLNYTVKEAVDLLNRAYDNSLIDETAIYNNVQFELTSDVLKANKNISHDISFFIVFTIDGSKYIAFQQNQNLVVYHEDDGYIISSSSVE